MPKIKKGRFKHPVAIESWELSRPAVTLGQIVFAKMTKSFWWPGMVIDGKECGQSHATGPNKQWIFWYGDRRVSLDCALQDGMHTFKNKEEKVKWARNGFCSESSEIVLSTDVKSGLEDIKKSMAHSSEPSNSSFKNGILVKGKAEVWPAVCDSDSQDGVVEDQSLKMSFFRQLLSGKINTSKICIACRNHSKAVNTQHPIFEGGLCEECEERLKNYLFALDGDGTMIACIVCANRGEVLVCDQVYCERVYCMDCIEELACENAWPQFKHLNPWYCMVCRGYNQKTDGCLVPKENWWENVAELFQHHVSHPGMSSIKKIKKKTKMKVLSLFDGISTGYFCLTQMGLNVAEYYAFETDSNAINVSKMNFSDKIIHLGDVEKFSYDDITTLCPVDLVIGGSPCNDLSAVNPARKGLYDHEGTGRLFFDFYRVLKTVESKSPNPVFWFYENVASMPAEYRHVISRFLNCQPNLIDAKHFSAQRRPRFYWGNIPGMSALTEVVPHSSPKLSSAIIANCKRTANVEKLNTVTTQRNSLKPGKEHPVIMNGELTSIWITELEEVFGFPRHFTDVGNLLPQQRLGLLGKSWSVQVIVNILKPLKHFFSTTSCATIHQELLMVEALGRAADKQVWTQDPVIVSFGFRACSNPTWCGQGSEKEFFSLNPATKGENSTVCYMFLESKFSVNQ